MMCLLPQVREPSFGMGVLEFRDSQTAIWQWYRNSEPPLVEIADEVVFIRDPKCQPQGPAEPDLMPS